MIKFKGLWPQDDDTLLAQWSAWPAGTQPVFAASAMTADAASIIPDPGSPGPDTTVGHKGVNVSGDYTVAADTLLYSRHLTEAYADTNFYGRILLADNTFAATLTNDGTIWNTCKTASPNNNPSMAVMTWAHVVNNGEIVQELSDGLSFGVFLTFEDPSQIGQVGLVNNGAIFAFVGQGTAEGIHDDDPFRFIDNHGIVAGQGDVRAFGIYCDNSGYIHNESDGQILAEAPLAIAVEMDRGGPYGTNVLNDGLIEAHSTDPSVASFGVYVAHFETEAMSIVNNGTIRADYAILDDSYDYSEPARSATIVTNGATGQIFGAVYLELGADTLTNHGTITGVVDMGDGNDTVDNTDGTILGLTDLDFGDDTYIGSKISDDAVLGDRGNDTITGDEGQDLLLGGRGDDVLTGGNGSDGLYGENGNDTIYAGAGDFVSGGGGADRIVLSGFGGLDMIDGGSGNDTLVLAGASRTLDFAHAIAADTIAGIDALDLGAGLAVVLRPTDVGALSDANKVTIDGDASNTVYLVSSWQEGAHVTVDGVDYRDFTSGADEVLVKNGVHVTVAPSAPDGAAGFDATPDTQAPTAGLGYLDSDLTVTYQFDFSYSLTIDAGETWESPDGQCVLQTDDVDTGVSLTNNGTIESVTQGTPVKGITGITQFGYIMYRSGLWDGFTGIDTIVGAQAVGCFTTAFIYNNGLIDGTSDENGIAGGLLVGSFGQIVNTGTISAHSDQNYAIAVDTYEIGNNKSDPSVNNSGTISADSLGSMAVGIAFINGGDFNNSGTVHASGMDAISVFMYDQNRIDNTGTIEAVALAGGTPSIAVAFSNSASTIVNHGLISGDIAVHCEQSPEYGLHNDFFLKNYGTIDGTLVLSESTSDMRNFGTMNGDIYMNDGTDAYYGQSGHHSGTIFGGNGNDTMMMGADNDVLDGGAGNDTLNGGDGSDTASYEDATAGVTVSLGIAGAQNVGGGQGSDTFVSIENVTGSAFADTLSDNSRSNVLSGGAGGDTLNLYSGGNDTALGGDGDDTIVFRDKLTNLDTVDGGNGNDTLVLQGDYSGGVAFHAGGLLGVETISLVAHHSYSFTMNDGNVAAGAVLTVQAKPLLAGDSLVFDGSHETDGAFNVIGGRGNDTITGGAGNDVLSGRGGTDHLTGGAGADHYVYTQVSDSTGAAFDTVTGFDAAADVFDLPFLVKHFNAPVTGALSADSFDTDLANALGAGQLSGHHALQFTASSGTYAGDTFLVVDMNNVAGYQAGHDLVIMPDHSANLASLSAANFI